MLPQALFQAAACWTALLLVVVAAGRCYVNAPTYFLTLERIPQRGLYMQRMLGPLVGPQLFRYEGIDGRETDAVDSVFADSISDPKLGATRGEIALYLGHLKRIFETVTDRPVLLLEDDVLPVLPGLWDAPLDDIYESAGSMYTYGVQAGNGSWVPLPPVDPHNSKYFRKLQSFLASCNVTLEKVTSERSLDETRQAPDKTSKTNEFLSDDFPKRLAKLIRIVKWGTPEAWTKSITRRWLNLKKEDFGKVPPSAFHGFKVKDLTPQRIEWPWLWLRTDVIPDMSRSTPSVPLSGTDLSSHPAAPASPLVTSRWSQVWSATSYVVPPRLLERLEGLVERTTNSTKFHCTKPCAADRGLTGLAMSGMLLPTVQRFTTHPLSGDSGIRTGTESAVTDKLEGHLSAFSQAFGNAIEQALVEIAYSVRSSEATVLPHNDFDGTFWVVSVTTSSPSSAVNVSDAGDLSADSSLRDALYYVMGARVPPTASSHDFPSAISPAGRRA